MEEDHRVRQISFLRAIFFVPARIFREFFCFIFFVVKDRTLVYIDYGDAEARKKGVERFRFIAVNG
ncbi:MAG TPA: hypothetical protein VF857_10040 [Spirochaetota bacterium]